MVFFASIGLPFPFCLPSPTLSECSKSRPEPAPELVLLQEEKRREQSEKLLSLLHGRPAIFQDVALDSVEAAAVVVAMLDDVWVNEDHKHHAFRCLTKAVRTPKRHAAHEDSCQDNRFAVDEDDDEGEGNIAQEDGLDTWTAGRKDYFCDRHLVVCSSDGTRSSRFISAVCVRRRGLRQCPPFRTMSVDGVYEMIRSLGVSSSSSCFEGYATKLRKQGFDGPRLSKMGDEDLVDIGVHDPRHRHRILLEIEAAEEPRRVPVVDLLIGGCGFSSRSLAFGAPASNLHALEGRTGGDPLSTLAKRRNSGAVVANGQFTADKRDLSECLEAATPGRQAPSSCICNACTHAEEVENTIIAEAPSGRARGAQPPKLMDSSRAAGERVKDALGQPGLGPNPFHGGA
mmetsp:Transcript_41614/g.75480  ORF Transcript_41614/g.75480 Transcript_41614/m.75480 type:complete len:400 (+) Transcript_41614:51-1250(+)